MPRKPPPDLQVIAGILPRTADGVAAPGRVRLESLTADPAPRRKLRRRGVRAQSPDHGIGHHPAGTDRAVVQMLVNNSGDG
jgi:hypothetical protein